MTWTRWLSTSTCSEPLSERCGPRHLPPTLKWISGMNFRSCQKLCYTNYSWGKLLHSICLVFLAFQMFVGNLSWACTPPLLSGWLAFLLEWTWHIYILEPVDLRKTTAENRCYLFLHPRIFICSVTTPQKVKASRHASLKIRSGLNRL